MFNKTPKNIGGSTILNLSPEIVSSLTEEIEYTLHELSVNRISPLYTVYKLIIRRWLVKLGKTNQINDEWAYIEKVMIESQKFIMTNLFVGYVNSRKTVIREWSLLGEEKEQAINISPKANDIIYRKGL